ncbi:restriction endonuclease subunit S [Xylella fastidiosa subsp. pauca]|uniref:restriction endonuclease subunit S n=1 Tax=Xylella fastidiosa TaxID=2371 RepID=UPI000983668B|nr:restriction endonuclease subunit S [Xylella fastidiosa]WGZ32040.1 restriction endonuclease subunit S [Xylella fastidiosa subsp. pauca]
MSRIDELIKQLCPNGVDYKAIGDLGELVRGNGMPKSDFVDSGIGCIHYGQIYTYYGIWTTRTKSFVSLSKAEKLAKVDPGDLVITNTSENVEDVCKAVAWIGEVQIVTGGHATVLKHDQDPKYLSYYLQTPQFSVEKKKHATGTKVIDVSAKSLAKIKIPVPPLEVQRQIVKVLDTFTTLEAELEAELEARRRQYQYYRDALLRFGEGRDASGNGEDGAEKNQWKATGINRIDELIAALCPEGVGFKRLGNVTRIRNGKDHKLLNDGHIPVYGSGGIMRYVDTYAYDKPSVLIPRKGSLGNLFYVDVPFWNVDTIFYTEVDESQVLPKFLYYLLTTVGLGEMNQAGGVPSQTQSVLNELKIPIPPLEVQARIVAVLDQFDTLVNDITAGLPAEIAARRQQYAYYRDRLLTFKEAV